MSGSRRSSSTRSGRSSGARSSAARPLSADPTTTSAGSPRSSSATPSRTTGWSSTTMTRAGVIGSAGPGSSIRSVVPPSSSCTRLDPAAEPGRLLGQQPDAQPAAVAGLRRVAVAARDAVVGHRDLHPAVHLAEADHDRAGVGVLLDVEQALAHRADQQRRALGVQRADLRELHEPGRHAGARLEAAAVLGELDRQRPLRAGLGRARAAPRAARARPPRRRTPAGPAGCAASGCPAASSAGRGPGHRSRTAWRPPSRAATPASAAARRPPPWPGRPRPGRRGAAPGPRRRPPPAPPARRRRRTRRARAAPRRPPRRCACSPARSSRIGTASIADMRLPAHHAVELVGDAAAR